VTDKERAFKINVNNINTTKSKCLFHAKNFSLTVGFSVLQKQAKLKLFSD
jgi:hypothetical protein